LKKIVVLTGAGISAESGLKTFRDYNGLWENYRVEEVATPEAFDKNPEVVLRFYNERRRQLEAAKPNEAHFNLAKLEQKFKVTVITQNIDDLHEKAGSTNVLHLHGELNKAESSKNPRLIYDLNHNDISVGDVCEEGHQLRPHVVWFGEAVPNMEKAIRITATADIFIIIGTSLEVYPAASLVNYTPDHSQNFLIDPNTPLIREENNFIVIKEKASKGTSLLANQYLFSQ
jgi:NAD-dependent deacetylase